MYAHYLQKNNSKASEDNEYNYDDEEFEVDFPFVMFKILIISNKLFLPNLVFRFQST